MKNWVKHNITLTILLAILSSLVGYASSQAVTRSDVDRLNLAVFGRNSQGDDLSARMGRVEENTKDIPTIRDTVNRIEGYITK